jgi:hypothetical protein
MMKTRSLLTVGLLTASVLICRGDITTGLVLHYKLDETGGNSAADSSPSANPGYLENWPEPEWVIGRMGGALRFNVNDPAHDDYIVTDHPLALNNQEQFSFAFWVKLEKAEHGSNPRFISPVDGKAGWVLWMPGVGVGFEDSRQPTTQPEVGIWHHYVVTLNDVADAGLYNVYVDAVQAGRQ